MKKCNDPTNEYPGILTLIDSKEQVHLRTLNVAEAKLCNEYPTWSLIESD